MPLNINWQQILLHLLNLVILFTGLFLLLYKPVVKFMNKRQEYYKNMDDEAKKKVAAAQELNEECARKIDELDGELAKKRLMEEQRITLEMQSKISDAQKSAEKIIADAKEQAEKEKEHILAEARKEIASLAVEATKVLLEQSSEKALERFLTAEERRASDEPKAK
ncbi:MAG: ATP synthase F0 subunit B [Clostridiales bacterium]|nr:ATP synthase F0 subunit B [Clostridiales bacterium]